MIRSIFGKIISPFESFLKRTAAGGIVLIFTTVIALVVSNSQIGEKVFHLWEEPARLALAGHYLELSLHGWVNDGLMTLFFLLVGLELKRELIVGELSSIREAALPIVAALGGMIVPAAIYWALNPSGPGVRGWGIPMATDIAFSVGILVLLGSRIPSSLIVFLTAFAIADDLGAVAIIALFYTGSIDLFALGAVAVVMGLLLLLNRGAIRHPLPYAVLGCFLWFWLLKSGIHPTMAGILLACAIPARSAFTPLQFADRIEDLQRELLEETDPRSCEQALNCPQMTLVAENLERASRAVQSPQQRLEHALHPWVTFIVLPVFAFSNLGIDFGKLHLAEALSPITLGTLLGLFPGKFIGIGLATFLAVKTGIGSFPKGVTLSQVAGVACLGGIGFTMSLFISNLAFNDPGLLEQAKVGILAASTLSGIVGLSWLSLNGRR